VSHFKSRALVTLCLLAAAAGTAALVAASGTALAGPPFQTDDPEPVDLGHYEFYVFAASDGTPLETDPVGPAFEINWGARPRRGQDLVQAAAMDTEGLWTVDDLRRGRLSNRRPGRVQQLPLCGLAVATGPP